jgi:signal transduction histidine kinase
MDAKNTLNLSNGQLIEKALTLSQNLDLLLDFMCTWSHDMGSLVGAIKGAIKLIDPKGVSPDDAEALEIALHSCEMLGVMIQNIMSFNGKEIEVRNASIDVIPWLRSILGIYRTAAKAKKIKIVAPIDEDVPEKIISDPNKLSQVVSNILSNAVKFSSPGGIIGVRLYVKGVLLFISVEDGGIGIPKDQLDKIFEPYHRLNLKVPGTGLGLAICKRNVGALGGTISVDSDEKEGSTFTVCLPLTS